MTKTKEMKQRKLNQLTHIFFYTILNILMDHKYRKYKHNSMKIMVNCWNSNISESFLIPPGTFGTPPRPRPTTIISVHLKEFHQYFFLLKTKNQPCWLKTPTVGFFGTSQSLSQRLRSWQRQRRPREIWRNISWGFCIGLVRWKNCWNNFQLYSPTAWRFFIYWVH